MPRPPVVAVFNTSPDTVDVLRMAFEFDGFVVVSAFTFEVRDGRVNLDSFLTVHEPDVIVYDIALPYQANWQLLQHLRQSAPLRGTPIVITTTNAAQVRPYAAGEPVHEIIGKPYDLRQLIEVVRQAIPDACERRH